jgi:GTPase SAR1 family protein
MNAGVYAVDEEQTINNISNKELNELKQPFDTKRYSLISERRRKMVILGEGCVGKTSLISRYTKQEMPKVCLKSAQLIVRTTSFLIFKLTLGLHTNSFWKYHCTNKYWRKSFPIWNLGYCWTRWLCSVEASLIQWYIINSILDTDVFMLCFSIDSVESFACIEDKVWLNVIYCLFSGYKRSDTFPAKIFPSF